ncbi:hypothetical protein niasHT_020038 [Heterodera trifolii]|uniref:Mevalonate kinase n=1 Tax=Heterodera trifolii TaxID=157864 RepID=A0ABD2KVF3_9BILA
MDGFFFAFPIFVNLPTAANCAIPLQFVPKFNPSATSGRAPPPSPFSSIPTFPLESKGKAGTTRGRRKEQQTEEKKQQMVRPTTTGGDEDEAETTAGGGGTATAAHNHHHHNKHHHQQQQQQQHKHDCPSVADHVIGVPSVSASASSATVPPPVRDKFAVASPRVAIVSSTAAHSHSSSAQNSPGASSTASYSAATAATPPPPPLIVKQYQQQQHHHNKHHHHHHHHHSPAVAAATVGSPTPPLIAVRSSVSGGAASSPPQSSPMRSLSSASGGLYVSAPGKIILFGEHAVVYGRTAIAGSIDLRTYLSLFTSADGRIYLSLPDMNIERTWMLKELQREIAKIPADPALLAEDPPSLELVVPIARKLSGACEEQCGVQNLAILAFWYLLIGVLLRKRALDLLETTDQQQQPCHDERDSATPRENASPPPSPSAFSHPRPSQQQSSNWASGGVAGTAPPTPPTIIGPCPLLDSKRKDLLAVKVTVRFKLPSCVGLGSSGAYCVCIAAALLQTAGLIPPPSVSAESDELTWDESVLDIIRKWSSAAESLIHGRASGLDAAICTYGGIASYTPGKRIENLQNSSDLLKVVLINSRVERNTSRLVQTVKENYRKYPAVVEPIFDTIDALAYEAAKVLQRQPFLLSSAGGGGENGSVILENGGRTAAEGGGTLTPHAASAPGGSTDHQQHNNLQPFASSLGGGRSSSLGGGSASYFAGGKRDSNASAISGLSSGTGGRMERNELTDTFDRLNELCRMNNQLLITLGVGHAKVDQICTMLGRYGIHPKMTGAGGGGCLFAFLKPDTSQTILNMIREELRKEGYEMWQPTLGGPGVLQHQQKPEIFTASSSSATSSSTTSSTGRGSGSSMAVPVTAAGSTRSNTPASSHQTTPSARHKK